MSLINREDLIEHLNLCLAESDDSRPYIMDAVVMAIRCAVEQMPEVDAVPVVRCQNFKHADFGDNDFCVCDKRSKYHNFVVHENEFCSFGDRREEP